MANTIFCRITCSEYLWNDAADKIFRIMISRYLRDSLESVITPMLAKQAECHWENCTKDVPFFHVRSAYLEGCYFWHKEPPN